MARPLRIEYKGAVYHILSSDFRRKEGSHRRCFDALENIRAEGLTPVIITCVERGTTKKETFHQLVNYAIRNKIQLVFSVAIPFGEWENNMDIICDDDDISYLLDLHKKYPFLTRDCYENMGSYGCPAAKQILYISEYGDVMPCVFSHISFGNILYESLRDIRNKILSVPEFKAYHPICLAGEDKYFINNYLSKTFTSKSYPPSAEEVFASPLKEEQPQFTKNIKKIHRPCPLCGSTKTKLIASGREHEFPNTTQDLFLVVKCLDCNLVYLNPRPDDSTLSVIYPKEYYCYKNKSIDSSENIIVRFKKILSRRFGFPQRISRLLSAMPEDTPLPLRILDIGCGNGEALDTFKAFSKYPVETTGLDFNEQTLQIVRGKGHKAICSRIEDALIPENHFDFIYSSNVIEHVADPLGMLQKASLALKPKGIFLCETPNFDTLDAGLFASSGHWGGFHFPRHWTFFTKDTFTAMADRAELEVISVSYHPVPIFWIWTMHSYLYNGKAWKNLADKLFPLFEKEQNIMLSIFHKAIFTCADYLLKFTTGRTGLMSATLRKR